MSFSSNYTSKHSKIKGVPFAPALSDDAAGKLLANVFESCDVEPSTLPLETLTSYTQYRRERFSMQKTFIAIVLLFFLILPVWFISPKISISEPEFNGGIPVYTIKVKSSFIPISRVSVAVNGTATSVYETGNRVFSVAPETNGTLEVRVTLANRQYNVAETIVNNVDAEQPVFLSSVKENGEISIYVSETGSGLDEEGIHAITISGEKIMPTLVDTETQCIRFAFPDENFTIFIPDKVGNTLTLVINAVE